MDDLVRAHADEVGALVALLVRQRGDAEDVLVDTLAAAALDPRLPTSLADRRLFVLRLAVRNTQAAERRSRAIDPVPFETSGPTGAEGGIAAPALATAMAMLSSNDRAIIVLRYLLDLDDAEIASVMGMRRPQVARRRSKARERVRDALEGGEPVNIEEIDGGD